MYYEWFRDPYERAYVRSARVESLDDRIAHITEKILEGRADPFVRKLAIEAVRHVPPRDWLGEVRAIWDFVTSNVRYTLDPYLRDMYQRARRTLQLGGGDCDDLTILMGAMLMSIGHPVALKVIDTYDGEGWNHIYLLTGIPPQRPVKWIPLDPSMPEKGMGWEMPEEYVRRSVIYVLEEV